MTRYQLAKLISWAGHLEARKRLQKVVYMLQVAGCPLGVDFYLHHYGPYSEDVARLTDEMVRQNLLHEEVESTSKGSKYSYSLLQAVSEELLGLEQTEEGKAWATQLDQFEEKAKKLLEADLKQLECASTILYFKQQGCDWAEAIEKAVKFKGTSAVRNAVELARQATS